MNNSSYKNNSNNNRHNKLFWVELIRIKKWVMIFGNLVKCIIKKKKKRMYKVLIQIKVRLKSLY